MAEDILLPLKGLWLPAEVRGGAVAIIEQGRTMGDNVTYSYDVLYRDIAHARNALLARNTGDGANVALLGSNSYNFVAVFMGILAAGATPVPVNPRQSPDMLEYIFADAQPMLVLRDSTLSAPPGWTAETLDTFLDGARKAPPVANTNTARADAQGTALILYTSGSTGKPKGVMISRGAMAAGFGGLANVISSHAEPRNVIAAPLFHMNGLGNLAYTLSSGGTGVILSHFDASDYARALVEHGITLVGGIPTFIAMLEKEVQSAQLPPFDTVRQCILGSAPLTDAIAEKCKGLFPNAALWNGYGTTEIGPSIFTQHPEGLPTPISAVGYPAAYVQTRLGQEPGEDMGTLYVKSPANFSGYLNQPETTAKKLVDGWYDTGDVMRRDEDGFYFFIGRDDDMFVCNGENIYPIEVETVLEQHPQIQSAAVISKDDVQRGAIPIAFVVPRPGAQLTQSEVKDFALENARAVQHPREVVFLDSLPLNGVGKVDKQALTQRL